MRRYLRDPDLDKNIATIVRALCVLKEKTQAEVAEALGYKPGPFNDRMAGKVRFTAGEVKAFAHYFGVSVERFYESPMVALGVARQAPIKMEEMSEERSVRNSGPGLLPSTYRQFRLVNAPRPAPETKAA